MTITTGTRIGAYEVTARIGAGGMGEVYRARDGRLNRSRPRASAARLRVLAASQPIEKSDDYRKRQDADEQKSYCIHGSSPEIRRTTRTTPTHTAKPAITNPADARGSPNRNPIAIAAITRFARSGSLSARIVRCLGFNRSIVPPAFRSWDATRVPARFRPDVMSRLLKYAVSATAVRAGVLQFLPRRGVIRRC